MSTPSSPVAPHGSEHRIEHGTELGPDVLEFAGDADAGTAGDTVAARIRARMGDCSPAERKVARTLLAAYPVAGFENVAGLAQLADVSGATVVRFTTRLGYQGFPDLQRALRTELEHRSASPAALYQRSNPLSTVHSEDPTRFGAAAVEDLTATFAQLSPHDFDTALALLADPKRRVWLVGGRYSSYLAEYFSASLQQLRPGVRMVPAMASIRAAAVSDFDAKDVLVAFDFRRYEHETAQLVEAAKQQKSSVVLITDQWVSPCATRADAVLTSLSAERGPFDSVVPVMALIEALFESVLRRIGQPSQQRMERIEQAAQSLGLLEG